jgi:hypothetical protein
MVGVDKCWVPVRVIDGVLQVFQALEIGGLEARASKVQANGSKVDVRGREVVPWGRSGSFGKGQVVRTGLQWWG